MGSVSKSEIEVWDAKNGAYIPLLEYQMGLKKKKGKRRRRGNRTLGKKFGELNEVERAMYEAVDASSQLLLEGEYFECLPHELLMTIMVFSQGFKFSKGDYVLVFVNGFLHADGTRRGRIREIVSLDDAKKAAMQLTRKEARLTNFGYRVFFGAYTRTVPMCHVFSSQFVQLPAGRLVRAKHLHVALRQKDIRLKSGRRKRKRVYTLKYGHITDSHWLEDNYLWAKPPKWRRKDPNTVLEVPPFGTR